MIATIQLLQPAWTGPDRQAKLDAFWREIDESPECVVIVSVFDGSAWGLGGLFSTRERAFAWAARRGAPCVIQPRRVDCPEWGSEDLH